MGGRMMTEFPKDFRAEYEREFAVFGPHGNRINVRVQYVGPLPEVGKAMEPEVFLYEIYQDGVRIECAKVEWSPENSPIALDEVAKSLALQWNTHTLDLHNS
jgi:hypothetical protein